VEPVIRAENILKSFDGFQAVKGVSFGVRPGECFGLLGPNGAGKTTLLKMIYCFSPRDGGNLSVFGLDPDSSPAEIKNRLGVVPQTDNLDEDISVRQNLEVYSGYFGFSRRKMKSKIQTLLEFMSLESKADAKIRELSGGLKRRLVIARALLNDPDLVVLDEPTTGLDPQVRHLIWAKLRELKAKGVTLLLTTHYMEEAHQLCDRLVVMDQGKILAEGATGELVASRIPAYVLELPVGLAPATVPAAVTQETHGDITFLYSPSTSDLENLARAAGGNFRIRSSSLEDLFLKLTGRDLHESE
jgi:lipooligosaccharide transport system ATP-binding protein